MRHAVHFPCGLADQEAQHLDLRRDLHQRELDALIDRQLLAERLALVGVFHALVETIGGGAQRTRGLPNTILMPCRRGDPDRDRIGEDSRAVPSAQAKTAQGD
jgi:hypothetical protein